MITSSHVFVFFSLRVGGSTQGGGYMALELFFVSARTNKRHHHLYPPEARFFVLFCCFIEVTMTVVKSVSDGLRD